MPRVFTSDNNIMTFADALSGSDIVLHYRMPTTAERIGYAAESIVRDSGGVKDNRVATRIKYGLLILTGFREGDFVEERDGKTVPVTTKDPDWKQKVETYAADLIELLAIQVFDVSARVKLSPTPKGDGGDPEKNSSKT